MNVPDELENRVAALENRVGDLEQRVQHSERDAAAARVLAGGADRDVAEIRGEIRDFRDQNNRVLNAMREDLTDFRQRFDRGFAEVHGRLDTVAAGQEQIVGMLETLISREKDS